MLKRIVRNGQILQALDLNVQVQILQKIKKNVFIHLVLGIIHLCSRLVGLALHGLIVLITQALKVQSSLNGYLKLSALLQIKKASKFAFVCFFFFFIYKS